MLRGALRLHKKAWGSASLDAFSHIHGKHNLKSWSSGRPATLGAGDMQPGLGLFTSRLPLSLWHFSLPRACSGLDHLLIVTRGRVDNKSPDPHNLNRTEGSPCNWSIDAGTNSSIRFPTLKPSPTSQSIRGEPAALPPAWGTAAVEAQRAPRALNALLALPRPHGMLPAAPATQDSKQHKQE